MDKDHRTFKEGQVVELKSFEKGYRGAWFRCKIKGIRTRVGELEHCLEYCDFQDETVRWTKIYRRLHKRVDPTLMIRPQYPPFYYESKMSDIDCTSEEIIVVNDVWKVGDLVDWWKDGCYWSGRLNKKLGPKKFQLLLFPKPIGEELSYVICCKDLRPSLDWSPQHGWKVPENEDHLTCARLVKPANLGGSVNMTLHEKRKNCAASVSSNVSASHLLPPDKSEPIAKRLLRASPDKSEKIAKCLLVTKATACMERQRVEGATACMEKKTATVYVETKPVESSTTCINTHGVEINKDLHAQVGDIGKINPVTDSSLCLGGASAELTKNTVVKDGHHGNDPSKKMRTDRSITLNSISSDTIEATIVDLEDLVNRIQWMKNILKFGLPLPDVVPPPWEFVEDRPFSMQKEVLFGKNLNG
ncbi:uncharacterized protein LOC126677005 isoform X2 [Mercurialis annua]|uniref:uncharacterized protein LOC126677005 isoform X2 n=1 Tax=Mercurialis annua TaxID=3986 RepID=UPI00215E035E|nr:uncharacterized protein LOC126677005 isoform X2 [Mercurialis annua]